MINKFRILDFQYTERHLIWFLAEQKEAKNPKLRIVNLEVGCFKWFRQSILTNKIPIYSSLSNKCAGCNNHAS